MAHGYSLTRMDHISNPSIMAIAEAGAGEQCLDRPVLPLRDNCSVSFLGFTV